ncbi:hypothetical protein ABPG75_006442 [Micractinium tetrahymenae]
MQRSGVLRQQNQARPGSQGDAKSGAVGVTGTGGGATTATVLPFRRKLLQPIREEEPLVLRPSRPNASKPKRPPQPGAGAASDVAILVQNAVTVTAQHVSAGSSTAPAVPALHGSLVALADPAVLALATDCLLAELLQGLQPLLTFDRAAQQWTAPGLASLLPQLQLSCQERLRRTTLPCDAALAGGAARFFARVVVRGGPSTISDGLLAAVAGYVHEHCRLLNGEVLAQLMSLLEAARYQPSSPSPIAVGNRVVERVLQLSQGKGEMHLSHFADVVEALAQLRCLDALSAPLVIRLAVGTACKLEEGQRLAVGQLSQLARVMQSLSIAAATTNVEPATLLAATAAWHLLVVRAEFLAHEQAAVPASGADVAGGSSLGLALSRMWTASRLLMALIRAGAPPSFTLPDRLGLVSHAAFLDHEHRTSSTGLTSAQRRVLAALSRLNVSAGKISVNLDALDSVFTIGIAVRMKLKSSGQLQRIAILIREPRHLLRGSAGAPLGAQLAQERLLKAAGWQVVALEAQCCLCLPVSQLSEELGALMMGEEHSSSLRYLA